MDEFFETWRQAWLDDLTAAGTSPAEVLLARASEALANRAGQSLDSTA